MQQELADLKKRNTDEMEALRQENSRLRRKIEVDPTLKRKAKEASKAARSPAFQPTKEESKYNPTTHTFTTTQQTPIPSTHPTHFPTTQLGHTVTPTPATTRPTTQVPYNIPTTLHTTHILPYNPHYLPVTHIPPHNFTSTFPTLVHHPIPPSATTTTTQASPPLHRFHRQHPLPAQWEPFTLDRYTCETDHDEHLKVYITHVALYTSQDAVFCKAFLITLKGPTLEWFTTLPPYFIDNFDALFHMFSTHFAGSRPHQTTTISLLGIRQEQGEPLRAFSTQPRFTRYASLTIARSRLLDEALQADLISPPRKTTTPPNADMTKYCRYHRNHGHTTEYCKALQDKIEELVRAGHFRRFIRRDDHLSRSRHPS